MFFTKTIDSIIADITTKIKHLRDVAVTHEQEAAKHFTVAALHNDLHNMATEAAIRAHGIATKFEELIK